MSDQPKPEDSLPPAIAKFPDAQRLAVPKDLRTLKPLPIINRITVVDTVYHQTGTEEANSFPITFSRMLESDEQVYRRHVMAKGAWEPLDGGWVAEKCKSIGMVVVRNTHADNLGRVLDKEAKEVLARHILEIGIEDAGLVVPFARVMRGESARFQPMLFKALRIRSAYEETKLTVIVIPG